MKVLKIVMKMLAVFGWIVAALILAGYYELDRVLQAFYVTAVSWLVWSTRIPWR